MKKLILLYILIGGYKIKAGNINNTQAKNSINNKEKRIQQYMNIYEKEYCNKNKIIKQAELQEQRSIWIKKAKEQIQIEENIKSYEYERKYYQ